MFELIKEAETEKKSSECSYDFMMDIMVNLLENRLRNEEKYEIYCNNMDVIGGFLVKNFDIIISGASERNILKDIQKRLVLLLNDNEKCQILQLLLDNYNKMNLRYKQLQDTIKPLIEIDFDKTFKMTLLWFPLFMKDKKYQEWIVKDIPNKCSWNTLKLLINGICDYIVSIDYIKKPCDQIYIEFINQYTTMNWDIQ